jgi:hypothetical protein
MEELGSGLFALFVPGLLAQGEVPDIGFAPSADPKDKGIDNPTGTMFIGVMSTSKDESYGTFNGKNHYNEWCFSINTIDQNIFSAWRMKWALMRTPQERLAKFTNEGKGKEGRDWSNRPPIDMPGSGGSGGPPPVNPDSGGAPPTEGE